MNPLRRKNCIVMNPKLVGRLVHFSSKNSTVRGWRDLRDFNIKLGDWLRNTNEIGLVVEGRMHEDILFYRVLLSSQGLMWLFHWSVDGIEDENYQR